MKDPQRWVGDQKIDLTPLFHWWTKHDGQRPLTAWVHVTGSIVGTNTWGWILNARVEDSSTGDKNRSSGKPESLKIILKNAPLRELAEFQSLVARQHTLTSQRESLSSKAKQAGEQVQVISAQQKADRKAHVRSARSLSVENKKWKQIEKEAKEELKQIDPQIKTLKEKLAAFAEGESYVVDCFALDSGQRFNGLEVYDHGRALELH